MQKYLLLNLSLHFNYIPLQRIFCVLYITKVEKIYFYTYSCSCTCNIDKSYLVIYFFYTPHSCYFPFNVGFSLKLTKSRPTYLAYSPQLQNTKNRYQTTCINIFIYYFCKNFYTIIPTSQNGWMETSLYCDAILQKYLFSYAWVSLVSIAHILGGACLKSQIVSMETSL